MIKLELKQTIEILSATAVVASLVFVGMQLRLERNVAIAEQYHNRAESRMANIRSTMESETYMAGERARWENGARPRWWKESFEDFFPRYLEPGAIQASIMFGQLAFHDYDNMHYQYQQELIDENLWLGYRERLKSQLNNNPIGRALFYDMAVREDFVRLMDSLIE